MSTDERQKYWQTPPEKPGALRVGKPQESAGGVAAVKVAMEHVIKQMGAFSGTQALLKLNQKEGYDCPGCAWPDPDGKRKTFEFCENGAKAVASEAIHKALDQRFFEKYSLADLAAMTDLDMNRLGRLVEPMFLEAGATHYRPISWEDAFALIADTLNALPSPDHAAFYTSGRTSNEAAFLYQLLVRLYGTNNMPDCSNMCHESSGVGLKETIGVGKGTVTLEDFNNADVIFIFGQNPGTNHPRMLLALQEAVRKGAQVVTVNPLPEAGLLRFKDPQEVVGVIGSGTMLTKLYLPVKINGDIALIKGIMKVMLAEESKRPGEVFDREFIESKTAGFAAFKEALETISWEDIQQQSGLTRTEIEQAGQMAANAKAMICCWAMGLTQHENAVANIQEVVNLLLLGGHLGRPGAGACPVRGHSNVQGDRTMGIWERPSQAFLDRLGKAIGFEPPREHGVDVVSAIEAMLRDEIKVFFAMGGNFISATPDTEVTADALNRCDLTVQVSTKLNRSHLVTGKRALILPCLGRTDIDKTAKGKQFVTVENSMSVVHRSKGTLKPPGKQLKSEIAIVCELAKALLAKQPEKRDLVDWDRCKADYNHVRDLIEKSIAGFEDYNQRVANPGGFYLPNAVRDRCAFNTADGKAHFTVNAMPEWQFSDDEYLMMTIRTHDQYNTTVYGPDDRYRGIFGARRVILMNHDDMTELDLLEGDRVDVTSIYNGQERTTDPFRVVAYPIPRRCVATYFPEANPLVPLEQRAAKSHTPASKSVRVKLAKI
jgi:molybdopterin-dependent oxidoreductase alpha subunit